MAVVFEGMTYSPWRDGSFRCPWKCSDPNYPQRKWASEKGFLKHLQECKGKPEPELIWEKPPEREREVFGECPDCGATIWKMQSCWWMLDKIVCIDCHELYLEAGMGHHDCAGLNLPAVLLEG